MKKITLVLFATLFGLASIAQKSALDRVTNAACDCINATEIPTDMTTEDAELFLGQCMAPSIMANMDALMKEMKIKEFNQESGYQIGIEVGKKLGATCPKFIELSLVIARNANNEQESEITEEEAAAVEADYAEDVAETGSVVGRFVREEGGTQRYIVINTEGVEEKFWWLYWFDGADEIQADPSIYLNREVYVEYMTINMFDGISRNYIPVKVLLSVLSNE